MVMRIIWGLVIIAGAVLLGRSVGAIASKNSPLFLSREDVARIFAWGVCGAIMAVVGLFCLAVR